MAGVVRVVSPGGRCWLCNRPSVAGEKLPGRRSKTRPLCKRHDELIFGTPPQPDPAQTEPHDEHA